MPALRVPPFRASVVWAAIGLAGAGCGAWSHRSAERVLLGRLIDDAKRSAVAFDTAELRQLAGARGDLDSPVFAGVKERLRRLAAVDPRVRFVYLFRAEPATGRVLYLADSAARGAKDESLPGDEYPQAAGSPGLQAILRTGEPASEGPLADDFGTWITAYAQVPGTPETGGRREILGLDVDAAGWARSLWLAGFEGALYVWILLGLPYAAWRVARRQHEQREVIRNLSEAMEQSHSAIMIVDLEGRIEYANRGLCRQIGYARRELIGRKWRDFQVDQPPGSPLAELAASVRAGRSWEGEWSNRRKDGTVYPVRGIVTPVRHRDGTLACFVGVFDDVSEIKRREAELREARDAALAGDRAKGQFLATMSHEVRTPLNGIFGFTNLLLDTALTAEQREFVQTIRTSADSLIQLTGDILDFARIESGKLKLDPRSCDPRECIEDALDLLAGRLADKPLELLHHVAPDVPAAVVADGGRLRQVLVNLVGNAVKFTAQGSVAVTLRVPAGIQAEEDGAPGCARLEFAVRDTGIGIAAEHQARLFRPFSQVDESTTRRYGGTGLGLAISRNLVELMGGTIHCESEPGRGSIFTFTIRAPVAAPRLPVAGLAGLRLGLAVGSPGLRREIVTLAGEWQLAVVAADSPAELAAAGWDVALVEAAGADAAPAPGLPVEKTIGLVPLSLPHERRSALRHAYRVLINHPLHHDALAALLAGSRGTQPVAAAPRQFGLHVLVAEDNPVNQRLIVRMLASLGCTAQLVDTGRRVLEELAARAAAYDLVLLDLHMPELDGLAALQEIRRGAAGPRAQAAWIVALTADAREQQRAQGLEAGLNDYLTKPLHRAELEAALQRCPPRREDPGPAAAPAPQA